MCWHSKLCSYGECGELIYVERVVFFAGWIFSQISVPAQFLVQMSKVLYSLKREMENRDKSWWPRQLSFHLILSLLYNWIAFSEEWSVYVMSSLCINIWRISLYWNAWSTNLVLGLFFFFPYAVFCLFPLSLAFPRGIKGQKLKMRSIYSRVNTLLLYSCVSFHFFLSVVNVKSGWRKGSSISNIEMFSIQFTIIWILKDLNGQFAIC